MGMGWGLGGDGGEGGEELLNIPKCLPIEIILLKCTVPIEFH